MSAPDKESGRLVEPVGHGEWLEGLWRAARSGRLPHGLLFHGNEGVGKYVAARWFAAGLLCEHGPAAPCRVCGPCKRFASGNHGDVFEVDARAHGLDALTVAFFAPRRERSSSGYQGPSVGEFLSLRPAEGGMRVVLVREAERMNVPAQNAFLKTLEEPSPGTVIVLETSQVGKLLATIQSRVVSVAVPAPPRAAATAVLAAHGIDAEEGAEYVRMAAGSPGRALRHAHQNRLVMRGLLLQRLQGAIGIAEARSRFFEMDGDFPGKTAAAQTRARVACLFDLGLELLRDAERLHAGVPEGELAHNDGVRLLAGLPRSARRALAERWLGLAADVELNLGAETLFDRALLDLPSPAVTR
ncbi:MAG: hypothetical protein R3F17_05545 [Planctomycetota bacterium]